MLFARPQQALSRWTAAGLFVETELSITDTIDGLARAGKCGADDSEDHDEGRLSRAGPRRKRRAPRGALQFRDPAERDRCLRHRHHGRDCHDNALIESHFHTLKVERVDWQSDATRQAAANGINRWIGMWDRQPAPHNQPL